MPIFTYKAKNVSGEQTSATIEAESIKSAANKLRDTGYFPVSIIPLEQKSNWIKKLIPFKNRKVGNKDVVIFTRRLADSLKGGLTLVRALKILENQTENPELAKLTKEMAVSIKDGKSLSATLNNYTNIFSKMYIAMVQAGETAGVLDIVLSRLADFQEKEEEIRFRINSALAYPVIMLFVGMISVIFLLSFVIPKFELMFQDLGQSIPGPTKVLIFVSHILRFYWWIYIPLFILAVILSKKWCSTAKGKDILSNLTLKLPAIGIFIKKDIISRFIQMLNILLSNGIPILDALNIAKNSIDNHIFSSDIDRIQIAVKEGQGLSKPIGESKIFPPLVYEMIAVGEETGNLESSLKRTADIYEREVEYAVKTMTSLLEPIIIVLAAFIVCFIAISMLLPVFQVSAGIR